MVVYAGLAEEKQRAPEFLEHVVMPDDTLVGICLKYKVKRRCSAPKRARTPWCHEAFCRLRACSLLASLPSAVLFFPLNPHAPVVFLCAPLRLCAGLPTNNAAEQTHVTKVKDREVRRLNGFVGSHFRMCDVLIVPNRFAAGQQVCFFVFFLQTSAARPPRLVPESWRRSYSGR